MPIARHASLAAVLLALIAAPALVNANPQHDRMRNCNKTAKEKSLKGDERKAFMKTCLSGKHAAPASTAQATPKPAAK